MFAGTPAPSAAIGTETIIAIARLNHAGYDRRRHCTAFAVAPRVVLTAAHCLDGVAAYRMTLLFGYDRMTWTAEGRAVRTVDLGGDVAALCLAADAPATLGIAEAGAGAVTVIGYGSPRTHLQTTAPCRLGAIAGRDALLDCPAAPGASGAPVLDGMGRAVAVVSRTARVSAVAATIPAGAAAACD